MISKLLLPISFALLIFASIMNIQGPCPFQVEALENQVIDCNYFQRLLEFDTDLLNGHYDNEHSEFGMFVFFRLNIDLELKKLIKYMKKNNYMITPGKYFFLDKVWMFHNGYFIFFTDNKVQKIKIFKFQKIPEETNLNSNSTS